MAADEQQHHDDELHEREAHQQQLTRDRAYARRIDEKELRERSVAAFDHFIGMGFTAHLIATQVRGAVEYRIALYPDGMHAVNAVKLKQSAAEFNLDFQIEHDSTMDGWLILMYPLT